MAIRMNISELGLPTSPSRGHRRPVRIMRNRIHQLAESHNHQPAHKVHLAPRLPLDSSVLKAPYEFAQIPVRSQRKHSPIPKVHKVSKNQFLNSTIVPVPTFEHKGRQNKKCKQLSRVVGEAGGLPLLALSDDSEKSSSSTAAKISAPRFHLVLPRSRIDVGSTTPRSVKHSSLRRSPRRRPRPHHKPISTNKQLSTRALRNKAGAPCPCSCHPETRNVGPLPQGVLFSLGGTCSCNCNTNSTGRLRRVQSAIVMSSKDEGKRWQETPTFFVPTPSFVSTRRPSNDIKGEDDTSSTTLHSTGFLKEKRLALKTGSSRLESEKPRKKNRRRSAGDGLHVRFCKKAEVILFHVGDRPTKQIVENSQ